MDPKVTLTKITSKKLCEGLSFAFHSPLCFSLIALVTMYIKIAILFSPYLSRKRSLAVTLFSVFYFIFLVPFFKNLFQSLLIVSATYGTRDFGIDFAKF